MAVRDLYIVVHEDGSVGRAIYSDEKKARRAAKLDGDSVCLARFDEDLEPLFIRRKRVKP